MKLAKTAAAKRASQSLCNMATALEHVAISVRRIVRVYQGAQ